MLLIPTPTQLLQAGEPLFPGGRQRRKTGPVDPYRIAGSTQLEYCDRLGSLSQQLAIMAHQQHRFLGAAELTLQPALGWHIQEVVWFVKQQDLVRSTQQRLQR